MWSWAAWRLVLPRICAGELHIASYNRRSQVVVETLDNSTLVEISYQHENTPGHRRVRRLGARAPPRNLPVAGGARSCRVAGRQDCRTRGTGPLVFNLPSAESAARRADRPAA